MKRFWAFILQTWLKNTIEMWKIPTASTLPGYMCRKSSKLSFSSLHIKASLAGACQGLLVLLVFAILGLAYCSSVLLGPPTGPTCSLLKVRRGFPACFRPLQLKMALFLYSFSAHLYYEGHSPRAKTHKLVWKSHIAHT